ncbi:hypothetical protein I551_2540 [Mycobacterium ulcerans str. Harvey]|uniref:Uncharacterized protein n=1 Tax=Mycobacterium ulcerans str. Harvey TaxID=1299332 RepID=A0ABN0R1X9_MYCUL|nr:hypothetical protein I551_2540 [Mycobacterium ulcerans str. Harvey]
MRHWCSVSATPSPSSVIPLRQNVTVAGIGWHGTDHAVTAIV